MWGGNESARTEGDTDEEEWKTERRAKARADEDGWIWWVMEGRHIADHVQVKVRNDGMSLQCWRRQEETRFSETNFRSFTLIHLLASTQENRKCPKYFRGLITWIFPLNAALEGTHKMNGRLGLPDLFLPPPSTTSLPPSAPFASVFISVSLALPLSLSHRVCPRVHPYTAEV